MEVPKTLTLSNDLRFIHCVDKIMVVTSTKKFITIFQHFSRVFDRKAKTNFERGVFLLSLVSTELCYAVITVLTAGGRPQSTEINT